MSPLVTTQWLAEHLSEVQIADASWYMPEDKRNPLLECKAAHIPGAVFFDIDAISDHTTSLPHMLPSPRDFSIQAGAIGISNEKLVVAYDGSGLFSAPRAWWMLKAMGHTKIAVLDGGFPKWRKEGRPIESGNTTVKPQKFDAFANQAIVRDFASVIEIVKNRTAQLIDARSAARFYAREPEPRPGLRGGHMPGALNVPWRALLNPDRTLKDDGALCALFEKAGINLNRPMVTTCGSGISAALLMLALEKIGAKNVALYDGSWSEWGGRPQAPVVTG